MGGHSSSPSPSECTGSCPPGAPGDQHGSGTWWHSGGIGWWGLEGFASFAFRLIHVGEIRGKFRGALGVGDWERLKICRVSASKRRNPVDFQSEKGFMGAFFLLEIYPWPMALMVSLSERQGFFAIREIQRGGGGKCWRRLGRRDLW